MVSANAGTSIGPIIVESLVDQVTVKHKMTKLVRQCETFSRYSITCVDGDFVADTAALKHSRNICAKPSLFDLKTKRNGASIHVYWCRLAVTVNYLPLIR